MRWWDLASLKCAGQVEMQAGFSCCGLEAEFLVLGETWVFALGTFDRLDVAHHIMEGG